MKTLLAIATTAIAVTTFAGPQDGPGKMQRGPRGGMEGQSDPVVRMVTNKRIAEKIGLTEEQTKKIKEIQTTGRSDAEAMRKQLREAMEKQTELLKAEKIDEAAVMAEIDKAFDVRKALAKSQTRRIIAIKAVLTPEQIAKALEEAKNPPKREMRGKGRRGQQGKGQPCEGQQCKGQPSEQPQGCPKGEGPKCEGPECGPGCDGPKGECPKGECPECGKPEGAPNGEPPCPPED